MIDHDLGIFAVKGSKDKKHRVNFGTYAEDSMPACTCPDWHLPCKHFFSVFNTQNGWIDTQNTSRAHTSVPTP